jgi:hypothetical protein
VPTVAGGNTTGLVKMVTSLAPNLHREGAASMVVWVPVLVKTVEPISSVQHQKKHSAAPTVRAHDVHTSDLRCTHQHVARTSDQSRCMQSCNSHGSRRTMLCAFVGIVVLGRTGVLGAHRNFTLSPSLMLNTGMLPGRVPSASQCHSRTTVLTVVPRTMIHCVRRQRVSD